MKLIFRTLICCLILLTFGCANDGSSTIERPHSPWVFRSVMDKMPRMITIALHDKMWVSYSAKNGSLYKAWKGGVNFDGAVYTTVHGPQPSSLGDGWMINKYDEPWRILQNGTESQPEVQYKGHQLENGKVSLNYELTLKNGEKIQISEQPEFTEDESGLMGLERVFTTKNVPDGAQVILMTNVNSVSLESSVKTDGDFQIAAKENREYKRLKGLDLDGKLVLNSNGTTNFTTKFTKKPLLENTNKIVGEEEEEDLPLGYRMIAKNDCKTCHNTFVNTVGPAYVEVAKKYQNTPENVAMLVGKVKNGGSGVWGQTPMTAHADMSDADINIMINYIMELDAEEEAEMAKMAAAAVGENAGNLEEGAEVDNDALFPGYTFKVFFSENPLNELADVDTADLVFEGIGQRIYLESQEMADLPDNFAIHASGYIRIPSDNNYVFRLSSDDGSKLWLDDKLIVDYDGLHGADIKDGEVALSAGYHPFRLEFFQGMGGKFISLSWRSFSDSEFSVIPTSAYFHHKKDAPASPVPLGGGEKLPGDGAPLVGVHPSYDLSQARPDEFLPKVAGMDFLPDGRLAVSTWDAAGAVYLVENAQSGNASQMSYKKIAEGLAEPLGLKVVDGEIYVLQKQELTKLIDHDGDEIIDEYQTVCNSWTTTANFHEFAFGLVYKDGHFYGNTAIAILPGGASANPQAPDRGKTFKISKETGEIEFIASGLRTPNGIGLGVDNEIFVADNQGDWLPSSKILHITEGAFFNSYAVESQETNKLPIKNPVVWLPQDEIGNSPTTPLALKDGIYAGQMIHSEVTHGGVKRVFVEKINGEYQGCVFRFIQGLEAGINRMVWGPDGGLYVGGVGSSGNWQQYGKLWYGLQRLKYNEKPTFEMLAVRAKTNGVEIEFTEPLAEGDGWSFSDFEVQQWWYEPTVEYGGPKKDVENLKVISTNVSKDRKKVFLELEGMKAEHVVYVKIPNSWVSEAGNELWTTEAWYTLNNIPENDMGEIAEVPQQKENNVLTEAEKAVGWQLLFDGKSMNGWHNFNKKTIGQSWKIDRENEAFMLNAVSRSDGSWQVADGGDIVTDQEFENYELNLEWKIQPCGNSGITFNVIESDKYEWAWETGPEMQILDNTCHADAKYPTHRAGCLYDMLEVKNETVRPAGQWNQVRLIIDNKNGKAEHWLNGRKVVEYPMHNDEWKAMIANSKFKDMEDFGTGKKGRIMLQDHGDKVWFRNVKIREL